MKNKKTIKLYKNFMAGQAIGFTFKPVVDRSIHNDVGFYSLPFGYTSQVDEMNILSVKNEEGHKCDIEVCKLTMLPKLKDPSRVNENIVLREDKERWL